MTNKAASALAKLRKTFKGSCVVCGSKFTGYASKKYCSNACQQRAKYRRMKEGGGAGRN